MATKTSTGSGAWSDAIWSPAGTPGQDDDVTISAGHTVTPAAAYAEQLHNNLTINGALELGNNHKVKDGGLITIGTTGSIYVGPTMTIQRKFYCATPGGSYRFQLNAVTPDAGKIDFTGYRFEGAVPTVGCVSSGTSFGSIAMLLFGGYGLQDGADYSLNEQGLPALGAELQEAKNEGVGQNFTSWKKGAVRSFKAAAKWPKVAPGQAGFSNAYDLLLRRMVQSPYNVLVITPCAAFCGQIENVSFGNPADGGRHFKATISFVEGRDG